MRQHDPRAPMFRLVLLAAVLGALALLAHLTGAVEGWSAATIRERVDAAGPLGFAVYLAIFTLGELLYLPGMLFATAGIMVWGRESGFFAAWLGSLVAVSVAFFVARGVGGRALAHIERPWLKRVLAGLEARPIVTVALLRCFLLLSPPVTSALGLTGISYRDYLLGSALGLAPPLLVATVVFERCG